MSDGPVIRPATPDDADRCGEIAVEAWRCAFEGWREILGETLWERVFGDWEARKRGSVRAQVRERPERAIVTEMGGEVVGFLTWRLHRDRAIGEISNNAVGPRHQGAGIGTAQVRWVLRRFRDEGMEGARVMTGGDPGHAPARSMYQKAGFERSLPYVEYFMEL
ncbi:MAG: GNAT family N-acetyltransferase [Armatimonadota bacterium]